jgi:hypothetical protein
MSGHRVNRSAVLGVAAGGVLLGHWITYRLASPHAHAREALLARTGHAYLGFVNDLGIALTVAAVAAVFLGHLTQRDHPPAGVGRWFLRLAGFQVGAFLAMEVLERVSSGAPLADLMHHGLLPWGVAVQVAVALAGAVAVRLLLRAAGRLQEIFAAPAPIPAFAVVARLVASTSVPAARPTPLAAGIRGPPPR